MPEKALINYGAIRLPKVEDSKTFKNFNVKFLATLKINNVKLKSELDDDEKEDPLIIDLYKLATADNDNWYNAATRARNSPEGKNADIVKIIELAEIIMEPCIMSVQDGMITLMTYRQENDSRQGCVDHYNEVRRIKTLPIFEDFPEFFFKFWLVQTSIHYRSVIMHIDIDLRLLRQNIEKVQNSIMAKN